MEPLYQIEGNVIVDYVAYWTFRRFLALHTFIIGMSTGSYVNKGYYQCQNILGYTVDGLNRHTEGQGMIIFAYWRIPPFCGDFLVPECLKSAQNPTNSAQKWPFQPHLQIGRMNPDLGEKVRQIEWNGAGKQYSHITLACFAQ